MNQQDLSRKIKELENDLVFFQDERNRLNMEFVMETRPSKRFTIRKDKEEAESKIQIISEALGILKKKIIESEEEIKPYKEHTNTTDDWAEEMNSREPNSIMIFISHAEADVKLAELLVNLILSSLHLVDHQIRCTSVPGHQLSFGNSISQLLKDDIRLSPIIIALITETSLASKWVMFELGASWALNKTVIPIIGPSLAYKDLPGPLVTNTCIQIGKNDASSRIRDALSQISLELKIDEKTGGKSQSNLEKFLSAYID
jgi:hypothetical protein